MILRISVLSKKAAVGDSKRSEMIITEVYEIIYTFFFSFLSLLQEYFPIVVKDKSWYLHYIGVGIS